MADPRVIAGRFVIGERLGRGGMGVVWRATDRLLGREVAVKEVRPHDGIGGRALRERLVREARAAARLNHPGAVTVHDVISEDDDVFIVMEFIPAPTLSESVERDGPLPPDRVAAIGLGLLEVLDEAHRIGIVHRDVKPANVMLLPRDRIKLADFGVARIAGDPTLTVEGTVLGSPAYMAPEQVRGERGDAATDRWALGATLYYAVEGRAAFGRATYEACIAAVLTEAPPSPKRAGADLAQLLLAMLAKEPACRPGPDRIRTVLERVAASSAPAPAEKESAPAPAAKEPASASPQEPGSNPPEAAENPPTENVTRTDTMPVPEGTEADTETHHRDRRGVASPPEPLPEGMRPVRRRLLIVGAAVLTAMAVLAVPTSSALRHGHGRPSGRHLASTLPASHPSAAGSVIRHMQVCAHSSPGAAAIAAMTLNGHPAIVVGCGDNSVRVVDLVTGATGRSFTAPGKLGVDAVAVGAVHGHQVVAVSATPDKVGRADYVTLWDLTTGSRTGKAFSEHTNGVPALAFGRLGGRPVVVSGSYDTTVQTWDPTTGGTVAPPLDTHSEVISLALTTLKGRPVIVDGGYGPVVRVFDQATGRQIGETFTGHRTSDESNENVRSVAVGTVGGRQVVVSSGDDGTIQMSDLATGARVGAVIPTDVGAVAVVTLHGRQVIVAGGPGQDVHLWDLATSKPISGSFTIDSPLRSLTTTTLDGRPVAVAGFEDGSMTVWSLG